MAQAQEGGNGDAEDGGVRPLGVRRGWVGQTGREEERRCAARRISAAPTRTPGISATVRATAPVSLSLISSHNLKKEKQKRKKRAEENFVINQKRPKPLWAWMGRGRREMPVEGAARRCLPLQTLV